MRKGRADVMKTAIALFVVAAAIAAGFASMVVTQSELGDLERADRVADGVWIDAGVTAAQVAAFDPATSYDGAGPEITHPPDGAVYPANFPPPRILWADEYASRTYQVVLLSGEKVLFSGVTNRRELRVTTDAWGAIKAAGGPITIRVSGGLVQPDGKVADDIASSEETTMTVAPDSENPTGMLLFGAKHRPARQPTGTVPLMMMHLRIDGFDFAQQQRRVLFRSSTGPQPTKMHPTRVDAERGEEDRGGGPDDKRGPDGSSGPDSSGGPDDRGAGPDDGYHGGDRGDPGDEITHTQCVSCHAISAHGNYIGVFSQTAEEAPAAFDAPNGFLTILTMPKREVVIQLPHAFMPRFHPTDPTIIVFGEVDETIGNKDQMMVRKSDLHILDLKTGEHKPLPGAATPERVENFPFWSPDGEKLVFIRTKPGEMWHGAAGHLDVATIDYNDGKGGVATDLKGASNNGKSNFLPVYSNDGRWIVFTQADQGFFSQQSADLFIVRADGGEARRMDCNSRHTESWHRFGPDGRWLAVVTNREDIRRPHIYISRFESKDGTCTPAVQMPIISGPGAHTHAFTWTRRFDWLDQYEVAGPTR